MICIDCNKKIDRSYGAAGLIGNYCRACAIKYGYTPEQMGSPPNCGSSIQKREYRKLSYIETKEAKEHIAKMHGTQIQPLHDDNHTIHLIEQLNGLLDRYNALYNMAIPYPYVYERINKTLENIEEAIAALCLRITEKQCILTVKE